MRRHDRCNGHKWCLGGDPQLRRCASLTNPAQRGVGEGFGAQEHIQFQSGSTKLPYGTLALGTEGIKDAISDFEDARKSDIENECLPLEFFDAEEAKAFLAQAQSGSLQTTPAETIKSPVSKWSQCWSGHFHGRA
ncbi:hypothetical protein F4604DRAFT_155672 [Suillus subluteus]|nr:hypothetical protein F4604DRAFT_155672 [Suillus subluteus]